MNNVYDNSQFFNEYSKMSRSQNGLEGAGEWHQLKLLFPDLTGKAVLDLGCGYGWHCQYAVERGASSALGLDLSEKMIEAAREKNSNEKIKYQVCGLDTYHYPENTYHCVISNLVLHYVENLDTVYRDIYKTLKQDGIFLMNIEHPVFTGSVKQDWVYGSDGKASHWPIDNYFYPGARKTKFLGQEVIKQHHTLTQILNGLLNAGFVIEVVEEAMPEESMLNIPGMKDEMKRPMMLLVRARKVAKG